MSLQPSGQSLDMTDESKLEEGKKQMAFQAVSHSTFSTTYMTFEPRITRGFQRSRMRSKSGMGISLGGRLANGKNDQLVLVPLVSLKCFYNQEQLTSNSVPYSQNKVKFFRFLVQCEH